MLLFVGLPLITIPQGTTVDTNLVYTCGPFRASSQMLLHDLCSQVSILGIEISFIVDFVLFFSFGPSFGGLALRYCMGYTPQQHTCSTEFTYFS